MFIQGIDYTQWHIAKQGSWNSQILIFHKETKISMKVREREKY